MEVTKDIYDKLVDMFTVFTKNKFYELEGKYKGPLNKANFTRLVQYCRTLKYTEENHPETLDISVKLDDMPFRVSLKGKDIIGEYCKTNSIQESSPNMEIISKTGIDFLFLNDFGFKVDLKQEQPVERNVVTDILKQMQILDKHFRYKKRFSYVYNKTVRFDLTIVKSSPKVSKSFFESGVLHAKENYEVEVEVIKKPMEPQDFLKVLGKIQKILLGGDAMIITNAEKERVLKEYLQLCSWKKKPIYEEALRNPKAYFYGPQPVTLERKNLLKNDLGITSILEGYTVTEKADGERMLLFVNTVGKCYIINNRLQVVFTGVQLNNITHCLFDGEHVKRDILGNNINMFAAFDVYYHGKKDCRGLPLTDRLSIMTDFTSKNGARFVDFQFRAKEFLQGDDILALSKSIYDKHTVGNFPYHVDGLIFTPAKLAVGASFEDDAPNNLGTWTKVFKWKPAEENTIDFLIKIAESGEGTLYVGYDPVKWTPVTAYEFLSKQLVRQSNYFAREFIPPDALSEDFSKYRGDLVCANGDIIENNTIVEFAYKDDKWSPLRVRKDKTESLRMFGLSNTANDYSTALNVWRSIVEPVTYEHITGEIVVDTNDIREENIYYFRSVRREKMASRSMMNFHNWVKYHMLISRTEGSKSLCDLACGKGGDLPKWIDAGFSKVFGVDVMRDNIENPVDGIYARTFENWKKPVGARYAYLTMDSSKHIAWDKIIDPNDQYVGRILWGDIDKSAIKEDTLKEYHGFVTEKFEVVSCQFALHYFYESEKTLDTFVSNVDSFLQENGYFIGTCLDGSMVKSKLNKVKFGEEINGVLKNRVIWNIKKLYKREKNIGNEIEIYMESIGRRITEYLVNMPLLIEKLAKYNIQLITMESFNKAYEQCDTKELSDVEKEYSFMNIFFMFQKKPKQKIKASLKKKSNST